MSLRRPVVAVFALLSVPLNVLMQAQRIYTAEDYYSAERWMGYNTQPLVSHRLSDIHYLPDGRVTYCDTNA